MLQMGEASVSVKPGVDGKANGEGATFRVIKSSHGIVSGGLLEFEAILTGTKWRDELKKLERGVGDSPQNEIPAALTITIGELRHSGEARFSVRKK